jgi:diguanylate cyclase (GGDEF)-like protein
LALATTVSITRLFFSLAIAYLILLSSGLLGFRWQISYPEEVAAHLHEQQNEINSLNIAFELGRQQLGTQTDDYARWDDTWFYIQQPNEAYLESNFVTETFSSLNLIAAMIINHQGAPLASWVYDPDSGELSRDTLNSQYEIALAQQKQLLASDTQTDITRLGNTPALVAASPISHSDGSGTDAGWLLFWRPVDQKFLTNISRLTRLQLSHISTANSTLQNIRQPLREIRSSHQLCLFDRLQQPQICLDITDPEYQKPQFMSSGTWTMLLILGIVPYLFFLIILNVLVKPIRNATLFLENNVKDRTIRNIEMPAETIQIREIRRLLSAYNQLTSTVLEQKLALHQLSQTDALTGIANRRAFDQALERAWLRMNRYQQSMALIMIDIDHFKRYNDSEGHPAGDDVLRQVAHELSNLARRPDELAARFGGEEFMLIIHTHSTLEMEQLRRQLRECIQALAIPHPDSPTSDIITISAGIAWIRNSGEWLHQSSQTDWLDCTDEALYEAKASGRNNSVLKIFDHRHLLPRQQPKT